MQESRKEKPSSVHKVKPPEVIENFLQHGYTYKRQARIHGF